MVACPAVRSSARGSTARPSDRPGRCGSRAETKATPGSAATASCIGASASMIGAGGQLGDEQERAVEAGAEPVDQQVVGLLGGGVLGEVALVGEAEPQAEHRQGQDEQHERAGDGRGPRAVLDHPAPPVGRGLASRLRRRGAGTSCLSGPNEEAGDEHDHGQREADRSSGVIFRPMPTSATATRPAAMRPRQRVRSIRSPAKPSSAGSSVSDARTVTATTEAAPTARPWTKLDAHEQHAEQRDHHGACRRTARSGRRCRWRWRPTRARCGPACSCSR